MSRLRKRRRVHPVTLAPSVAASAAEAVNFRFEHRHPRRPDAAQQGPRNVGDETRTDESEAAMHRAREHHARPFGSHETDRRLHRAVTATSPRKQVMQVLVPSPHTRRPLASSAKRMVSVDAPDGASALPHPRGACTLPTGPRDSGVAEISRRRLLRDHWSEELAA